MNGITLCNTGSRELETGVPNSFKCLGESIDFSNGATEALYKHWLRLLKDEPDRPGKRILQPFLERMADLAGSSLGISGFGMTADRMPEPLLDMRAAWTLMRLVRLTAEDVRSVEGIPPDAWDKTPPQWRSTLAEYGEERTWKMHRTLENWVLPPC